MEQNSLKSLFAANVFSSISVLKANTSGYPYVTLVGRHGSNNVYFGQKSADLLAAKYKIGDNISKELGTATIILATNAAGEKRYKLSIQGVANDYSSVGEMEDIFGVEQTGTLDVVAFVKDFSVAPTPDATGDSKTGAATPTLNTSKAPGEGEAGEEVELTDEQILAAAKAAKAKKAAAKVKP